LGTFEGVYMGSQKGISYNDPHLWKGWGLFWSDWPC
jgi:hypothetical protein